MKEKVLVGITIQENSRRLIAEGHKLAKELDAPLHILHIRKGETIFDKPESRELLEALFAYGGELGGEIHFLCSNHVSQTFTDFVKENAFTHLVIGESPAHLSLKTPSVHDKITDKLSDINITVLSREPAVN